MLYEVITLAGRSSFGGETVAETLAAVLRGEPDWSALPAGTPPGVVSYTRNDVSGFRDVDIISAETGQKVRQSQFVEQEEFRYIVDIFFLDGATGELLFRDRLQRAVVFQGQSNDPFAAFFSLSESIAADVLAVVVITSYSIHYTKLYEIASA